MEKLLILLEHHGEVEVHLMLQNCVVVDRIDSAESRNDAFRRSGGFFFSIDNDLRRQ